MIQAAGPKFWGPGTCIRGFWHPVHLVLWTHAMQLTVEPHTPVDIPLAYSLTARWFGLFEVVAVHGAQITLDLPETFRKAGHIGRWIFEDSHFSRNGMGILGSWICVWHPPGGCGGRHALWSQTDLQCTHAQGPTRIVGGMEGLRELLGVSWCADGGCAHFDGSLRHTSVYISGAQGGTRGGSQARYYLVASTRLWYQGPLVRLVSMRNRGIV